MSVKSALWRYGSADLYHLRTGALGGALAGVAAGAVSRLSMRGVAVLAGMEPSFSLGGTFAILIIGAIMGMPFAWLYQGIGGFLPVPERWRGAAYGVLLFLTLVLTPFALFSEGELDILPLSHNLALFAPVPLAYGLALPAGLRRFTQANQERPARRVGLPWLIGGLVMVWLVIAGLTTLGEFGFPFPTAVSHLVRQAGVSFTASHSLEIWLLVGVGLAYLGSTGVVFWRGSHAWMAKFAALALLTFGAAFFTGRDTLAGLAGGLHSAPTLAEVLQAVGLSLVITLQYLLPDGRFTPRWTRPLAGLWYAWCVVWALDLAPGSFVDPGSWPDGLFAGVILAGLGSGVLAQVARYRNLDKAADRSAGRPVLLASTLTLLLAAPLWALISLDPSFEAHASPRLALGAYFAFGPYLLPWLVLPLWLAFLTWRRYLWAE